MPTDHIRLKEARRLATRLVGADASAITAVHPLRWPGSWHRKEAPRLARIVALNEAVEIDLGDALVRLREAAEAAGIKLFGKRTPNAELIGDIRDIVAALEIIPNDDLDWAEWSNIGATTHAATAGSEEGFEAFDSWSQKSGKYDYAACRERWEHWDKSPYHIKGAGSLIYEARQIDPAWRKPSDGDALDDISDETKAAAGGTRIEFASGEDYEVREVVWAWKDWLAFGKLHLFAGTKAVGKSTFVYTNFAAPITVGGLWPDGGLAPIGDVFIWSSEDDVSDTILPRIMAAGGDRRRVKFARNVYVKGQKRRFDPSVDMPLLMEAFREFPEMRMMIIDPVVMASRADSHKNSETRIGLQPVVDLAEERRVVMIGITHFAKHTRGRDLIERIAGTLAYGAMARIIFAAAKGVKGQMSRFVRVVSSAGPDGDGYEYELVQKPVPGHKFTAQVVECGNPLFGDAQKLIDELNPPQEQSQMSRAMSLIRSIVFPAGADGISSNEVAKAAEAEGISWRTMQDAKAALPIKSKKHGDHWNWIWHEPEPEGVDDDRPL